MLFNFYDLCRIYLIPLYPSASAVRVCPVDLNVTVVFKRRPTINESMKFNTEQANQNVCCR